MTDKEVVVVASPLERRHTHDGKVFCCRIRALGLTAYGNTPEEAETKVKRMFATWVGLHRKTGTLDSCLKRSKLMWWYESEYDGGVPYEVILPEGGVRVVEPKNQAPKHAWSEINQEMVAAH